MSISSTHLAAIVWDLDGTLIESAPDLAAALNALLAENGEKTHDTAAVRLMIGGGVPKLLERGFRASGTQLEPGRRDSLVPRFMEIYSACATDSTHLLNGAREVLEYCTVAGIRQGLCTNKPASVTRKIIAALEIDHYFASVIGGDSTAARKPDPLPLTTCLDELGIAASRAVMVGDSGADVGAARAAGVPVLIVSDGYSGTPAAELGADLVLEDIRDIPERLVGFATSGKWPFQRQHCL